MNVFKRVAIPMIFACFTPLLISAQGNPIDSSKQDNVITTPYSIDYSKELEKIRQHYEKEKSELSSGFNTTIAVFGLTVTLVFIFIGIKNFIDHSQLARKISDYKTEANKIRDTLEEGKIHTQELVVQIESLNRQTEFGIQGSFKILSDIIISLEKIDFSDKEKKRQLFKKVNNDIFNAQALISSYDQDPDIVNAAINDLLMKGNRQALDRLNEISHNLSLSNEIRDNAREAIIKIREREMKKFKKSAA